MNNDSPTSISNGSGKSSVPEALRWVLYGTTNRGLKGDAVVNRRAGKDCMVQFEWDDYMVWRFRKHTLHGTGLKLFHLEAGTWNDVTCGVMKETQALLEKLLKMNELTFCKVAYFGQGDVRGFAGLSDKELKAVFEQAMGLSQLSEYQALAKAERQKIEQAVIDMVREKEGIAREI